VESVCSFQPTKACHLCESNWNGHLFCFSDCVNEENTDTLRLDCSRTEPSVPELNLLWLTIQDWFVEFNCRFQLHLARYPVWKQLERRSFIFLTVWTRSITHTHTHTLSLSLRLNCSSTEPSVPQLNLHRNMTDRIVEFICSFQPHLRLQAVLCSVRVKIDIRMAIFFPFPIISVWTRRSPTPSQDFTTVPGQNRSSVQFWSWNLQKEYDRQ
jgi:hypothetical protein